MTDWVYDNSIDPSEYESIVYLITNTLTGQMYVGKKNLWLRHKGKSHVESEWKTYYGSSVWLTGDIETYGKEHFKREVLHWCYSKNDSRYLEAKEQFARNVLGALLPNGKRAYYNGNILGKLFQAPGAKTAKAPLKTVVRKVTIGKRLINKVMKHTGTQKDIAAEFGISIGQVAKIQRENKK